MYYEVPRRHTTALRDREEGQKGHESWDSSFQARCPLTFFFFLRLRGRCGRGVERKGTRLFSTEPPRRKRENTKKRVQTRYALWPPLPLLESEEPLLPPPSFTRSIPPCRGSSVGAPEHGLHQARWGAGPGFGGSCHGPRGRWETLASRFVARAAVHDGSRRRLVRYNSVSVEVQSVGTSMWDISRAKEKQENLACTRGRAPARGPIAQAPNTCLSTQVRQQS